MIAVRMGRVKERGVKRGEKGEGGEKVRGERRGEAESGADRNADRDSKGVA